MLHDDTGKDLRYGKLFDSSEDGVKEFSELRLKADIYTIKLYSYNNWSIELIYN